MILFHFYIVRVVIDINALLHMKGPLTSSGIFFKSKYLCINFENVIVHCFEK
jgi:hypothetical protein